MSDDSHISLIGTDGRVRSVPMHLKKNLIAQGYRIIINPKEQYYPQYDRTNPNFSSDSEITDNIEEQDFLEVKKI